MIKVRDGWRIEKAVINGEERDIPLCFFNDKLICAVRWYPIHPVKPIGYIFEEVIWDEAATDREKLEAPVFFAKNCGQKLIGWSRKEDRVFFRHLERNGCIKCTGYSDIVFFDQRAKTWETCNG